MNLNLKKSENVVILPREETTYRFYDLVIEKGFTSQVKIERITFQGDKTILATKSPRTIDNIEKLIASSNKEEEIMLKIALYFEKKEKEMKMKSVRGKKLSGSVDGVELVLEQDRNATQVETRHNEIMKIMKKDKRTMKIIEPYDYPGDDVYGFLEISVQKRNSSNHFDYCSVYYQ